MSSPAVVAANNYFSAVLTDWYVPFTVVPRLLTAAMMATLRPAAIIAYSIEVAPDSSEKNWKTTRTDNPPGHPSPEFFPVWKWNFGGQKLKFDELS